MFGRDQQRRGHGADQAERGQRRPVQRGERQRRQPDGAERDEGGGRVDEAVERVRGVDAAEGGDDAGAGQRRRRVGARGGAAARRQRAFAAAQYSPTPSRAPPASGRAHPRAGTEIALLGGVRTSSTAPRPIATPPTQTVQRAPSLSSSDARGGGGAVGGASSAAGVVASGRRRRFDPRSASIDAGSAKAGTGGGKRGDGRGGSGRRLSSVNGAGPRLDHRFGHPTPRRRALVANERSLIVEPAGGGSSARSMVLRRSPCAIAAKKPIGPRTIAANPGKPEQDQETIHRRFPLKARQTAAAPRFNRPGDCSYGPRRGLRRRPVI